MGASPGGDARRLTKKDFLGADFWRRLQKELRTRRNPSSLHASTTAARFADARVHSSASSASAACVSEGWHCGVRFLEFRNHRGKSVVGRWSLPATEGR